jgi:3-oxoacyl-[acyl-carrier protein] reductase
MDLQLAGKRALVTGSSSGIGAAIARMLAREGVTVVVHGRDAERTRGVADGIRHAGGLAHPVTADLASEGAGNTLRAFVDSSMGGIDILVNNAGGRPAGWSRNGWLGQSPNTWLDTYSVNVLATARLIDAFTPSMVGLGWGRVIQISSAIALHQPPHFPDYQAAKAAEINLTRSLSRALAGSGVTSNVISCGIIHSPGSQNELQDITRELGLGPTWQSAERKLGLEVFRQSVGRVGRADDIAGAVAYLASPLGDFITGINLVIDGGV